MTACGLQLGEALRSVSHHRGSLQHLRGLLLAGSRFLERLDLLGVAQNLGRHALSNTSSTPGSACAMGAICSIVRAMAMASLDRMALRIGLVYSILYSPCASINSGGISGN